MILLFGQFVYCGMLLLNFSTFDLFTFLLLQINTLVFPPKKLFGKTEKVAAESRGQLAVCAQYLLCILL